MLRLRDSWIWDFWIADTGAEYHLFFLRASRALHDPVRRHRRASVGHAISTDLREWQLVEDALVPGDAPRWDDLATWTGSVIEGPDGVWRMYYTGLSRADDGLIQRIGVATSPDLMRWTSAEKPIAVSDPRWYEPLADGRHDHEAWRDPWVYADPEGDGWHMLVTARARHAPDLDGGVLGYAWSADLVTWKVREPRSRPGAGFGQFEVPQVAEVHGRGVLVFSCLNADAAPWRRSGAPVGAWAVPIPKLEGPFDIGSVHPLVDDRYYGLRLVQDRAGQWMALAFHNREPDGRFDGRLSDPMPVHWTTSGLLAIG